MPSERDPLVSKSKQNKTKNQKKHQENKKRMSRKLRELYEDAKPNVKEAFKSSAHNRYLFANIIYLIYAIGILQVDYGTADYSTRRRNYLYLTWAIVHLIDAFLYWWSWVDKKWYEVVVWPEYLNMIGAGLYLASSIFYFRETEDLMSKTVLTVHYLEFSASLIEVLAAFGWNYAWYKTYPRRPGQGWTLDDPDVWANLFITVPSLVYLTYNIQIISAPDTYNDNFLYYNGDILYFIGAVFYTLASLRDDGWFWYMPLAGGFNYVLVENNDERYAETKSTKEIPDSENQIENEEWDSSPNINNNNTIVPEQNVETGEERES